MPANFVRADKGKKAANGGQRESPVNDDGWTTPTLRRYSLIELNSPSIKHRAQTGMPEMCTEAYWSAVQKKLIRGVKGQASFLSLFNLSLQTTLRVVTSAGSLSRSSSAIGDRQPGQSPRVLNIPRRAAAFEELLRVSPQ